MRITKKRSTLLDGYKLLIVDDDEGLIDSITTYLERNGYSIRGFTNPIEALGELEEDSYDLLILDYFMTPIKGDDFVSELREFDTDIYVILLTGHKDLAPPLTTIKAFDIQAYCEKSHRLDQLLLLIESGIKSISQMRRIRNYRDGLDSILAVLPEIGQLGSSESIIAAVLNKIIDLSTCLDAFIMIDGLNSDRVMYKGSGKFDIPPDSIAETLDPNLMDTIKQVKTSRAALTTDSDAILPIVSNNDLVEGVIYISGKIELDSSHLLDVFSRQAASLIQNVQLHEELTLAYSTLKSSYMETIEALRLVVDTKDVYTRGHSDRVSMYALLIGRELGLNTNDLEDLRIGGLFHDIGKIGTSEDILLKKAKLTDEEMAEIRKHPSKGSEILSAISAFVKIKHIVGSHHERYDGHGYPAGLAGNDIPYEARIISVADAYDAMMSNRQYRSRLTLDDALDQLKEGRGTQYDEDIVDCFISIIEKNWEDVNSISKLYLEL